MRPICPSRKVKRPALTSTTCAVHRHEASKVSLTTSILSREGAVVGAEEKCDAAPAAADDDDEKVKLPAALFPPTGSGLCVCVSEVHPVHASLSSHSSLDSQKAVSQP